jgi:hypothetical protein
MQNQIAGRLRMALPWSFEKHYIYCCPQSFAQGNLFLAALAKQQMRKPKKRMEAGRSIYSAVFPLLAMRGTRSLTSHAQK